MNSILTVVFLDPSLPLTPRIRFSKPLLRPDLPRSYPLAVEGEGGWGGGGVCESESVLVSVTNIARFKRMEGNYHDWVEFSGKRI